MVRTVGWIAVLGIVGALFALPVAADAAPTLRLRTVASGLESPTWVGAPPADPRLFATEQGGRLLMWKDGRRRTVLDLRGTVSTGGEQGLLTAAFHERFARNGRFWVYFTNATGDGRVFEYRMRGDRLVAGSARRILSVPLGAGAGNHNGGHLWYRDGQLWLSVGDGGDTPRLAQARNDLRGKLLRIDVDRGYPYRIPADNPYATSTRFRKEIYALGLRNPWRFAIDPANGDVFVGDVGQGTREEVSVLRALRPAGANFGWPRFEGTLPYVDMPLAPGTRHRAPIAQYTHAGGSCSITGGIVFRGTAPAVRGRFLYADFCRTWISGVRADGSGRFRSEVGVDGIVSFAYGPGGRVYLASRTQGRLYRLSIG